MSTTWARYPLVRRDVSEAQEVLHSGALLTPRQWAALVWAWTDIPTGYEVWSWNGERLEGLVKDIHFTRHENGNIERTGESVRYRPPSEIAKKTSRWTIAAGWEQMKAHILLMERGVEFQLAWNFLHGHYFDFTPEVPPEEASRQRVQRLRQMTGIGRTMETPTLFAEAKP